MWKYLSVAIEVVVKGEDSRRLAAQFGFVLFDLLKSNFLKKWNGNTKS